MELDLADIDHNAVLRLRDLLRGNVAVDIAHGRLPLKEALELLCKIKSALGVQ